MKKLIKYSLICLLALTACTDMYLPPKNTVTDEDLLSNQAGMSIYMARMYRRMPFEDFKYMAEWGFEGNSWLGSFGQEGTGESVQRDCARSFTSERTTYWGQAFTLLRDANHLIEALPDYRDNYAEPAFNEYLGEGYFVRAFVFYQMARRFGGIPLVTSTIAYPAESDALEVPRSSEEETWNQILSDFDMAISLLPSTGTMEGYANRYVALAFKAEAMLYAGSVAKYNETVSGRLTGVGAKTGVRVIGFDSATWKEASAKYFAEAYKAAREVMKSGEYSLYRKAWKANDKAAQYKNMVDMYQDLTGNEDILVRHFNYPNLSHGLDAYSSPFIFRAPLSAGTCPTLDFVELFDGFDRYENGHIRVTDGTDNTNGNYLLFDSTMDFFEGVEPRLRAYVILPGDVFKNREIEVRSGVYTGSEPIKPIRSDYTYASAFTKYSTGNGLYISPNSGTSQTIVDLPGGGTMYAAGENGPFNDNAEATVSGFYLRKYLDESKPVEEIGEGKSDQPFILMRYADVLLAAAEAAVELSLAGKTSPVDGDDMLAIATEAIADIRDRAGADPLTGKLTASVESRDIVRKERRKELAFEHKSKWDIRRWRVAHEEGFDGFWGVTKDNSEIQSGNQFRFRGLFPFYSAESGKYFFDASFINITQKNYAYNTLDYYFAIPSGEVAKSAVIDQQPNR